MPATLAGMRLRMLVMSAAMATASCSPVLEAAPAAPRASSAASGKITAGEGFRPDPHKRVPRRAGPLARRLVRVTRALRGSVKDWVTNGHPSWRKATPRIVVLQALYQQRIYRVMARKPVLARRAVRRLPKGLRWVASSNAKAGRKLRSLVTPLEPPIKLETKRAEAAGRLLKWYKRAQRRFRVDWEVLAAVNYVESKFGRVKSSSSAGAQGPMQFLPSTWAAYGLGGDIHDDHDAIMGAGNYLRASGAPGDYGRALYAYNHARRYVEAVLVYARQMRRRPRTYFSYYNRQVFVITTRGDVRLTGPGL